jgi:SAM-dependent methyltransferase
MRRSVKRLRKLLRRGLCRVPGYRGLRELYNRLTGAQDEHWARAVMNRETLRLVTALAPETLDALEISGDRWRDLCEFRSYRSVAFPEYDLCAGALGERFDLIFAEQVFEHLLWPYRAGRHVYRMLRPGGHFLITTPFLIRVHGYPVDCTRWTETGLRHFLAECGFPLEEIRTGSWGNRACVRANFHQFPRYRARLHSLRNEPEFPVVVWALALKPASPEAPPPPPAAEGRDRAGEASPRKSRSPRFRTPALRDAAAGPSDADPPPP